MSEIDEMMGRKLYRDVREDQKRRLQVFRTTHPRAYSSALGLRWEYISSGHGDRVLVLLPGGIRVGEAWFRLIQQLENRYRIIAPTFPPARTMADLVDGLASILDTEGVRQINLVGTSFGGMVAQCFVRRYPDVVDTLVLSNTSAPDPGYADRLTRLMKVLPFLPTWLVRAGTERNMLKVMAVPNKERSFLRAFVKEAYSSPTIKKDLLGLYVCTIDFCRNYQFTTSDLLDWPGRLLIMESDDDAAFSERSREALKALYPQAQVHTFSSAGHTPGYTRPDEYGSVLAQFLEGSGDSGGR